MKKILIVICTDFVSCGGLATVMMNYYRFIDKEYFQIDFASTNVPDKRLLEELEENGSVYYCLGKRKKNPYSYAYNLEQLLKAKRYDVIHVNGNSATMAIELLAARKVGIPVRIAHVHTTQSGYELLHKVLWGMFRKSYTKALACSKQAGEWLFQGSEYQVLNNAIDTERFSFYPDIRNNYREALNLKNKFVVGTIGKMYAPKNHSFLVKVFFEIWKMRKDAVLLLVGDGELRGEIEGEVSFLGIENNVCMLGMRTDNAELLQCMDIFLFPSIWEGLGLALIEAQATGLLCYASANVPKEAGVTELVNFLELDKGEKYWADIIMKDYCPCDRTEACEKAKKQIQAHGYDIAAEVKKLMDIYNRRSQ